METVLADNGAAARRRLAGTVVFETEESAFAIVLHPDILDAGIDRVRIERVTAPAFAVTLDPADFAPQLRPEGAESQALAISVRESEEAEYEPETSVRIPKIQIQVPEGQLPAPVTLSLFPGSAEPSSLRIQGVSGRTPVTRYNPATRTLDARISADDVYTFGRDTVHFTDLSRINVVYGFDDGSYLPDRAVTRAEFVAFVMRVMGWVNNSLKSPFLDVPEGSACYHEIASAYYRGIINGYDEEHFVGDRPISKTQIYVIIGRILERELGYWIPDQPDVYLSGEYSDAVAEWARESIALSTREGLVIRREDGRFEGGATVNRGDAALIIYGLYQRLA